MVDFNQIVCIPINRNNQKYYREKGYDCQMGGTISISLKEATRSYNNLVIEVICDYCGEKTHTKYNNWLNSQKRCIVAKDCCHNCGSIKIRETLLKEYGVDSAIKIEGVRDKIKQTNLIKYGVEYTMQNADIQAKRNSTNLIKYGNISPLGNEQIRDKAQKTLIQNYHVTNPTLNKEILAKSLKTISENGNQKVSSQQQYFYEVIGGELNYPFKYYNLDIALLPEKIDIEYNGGGHNLQVKLGTIEESQFIQKEAWRKKQLYSEQWKIITFISPRSKILDRLTILNLVNASKQYFVKENRHWVEVYIDTNTIITSQNSYDFNTFINLYNGERLNERTSLENKEDAKV